MVRRRRMYLTNGCWTSPVINLWSGLQPVQNLFHDRKKVVEWTICVITMDFKGKPDQIVISWEHWGMQVIKGQEDREMTRGLRLLSYQGIEIMIPKWWTWWRWLVHSSTAWWVGEEGYSCISITTCPCINSSYVVWLCLVVCLLVVWVVGCLSCQLVFCLLLH